MQEREATGVANCREGDGVFGIFFFCESRDGVRFYMCEWGGEELSTTGEGIERDFVRI
ncbi:hypothetical protein KFK09_000748 [Dendrobium nobile]|uniref:Uncharacterized protein n=1 Tax=Dendrobium nobile TaxID=94219 RepID=A0A8T3CCE7_DENNO|nr:hypothetical protein KFK09_000748 [Dendrobium nobile]